MRLATESIRLVSGMAEFCPARSRVQSPPEAPAIHPGPSAHSPNHQSIVDFGFFLQKQGYAEQSILRAVKVLRRLSKFCNLDSPEDAKSAMTRLSTWSLASKELCCNWLDSYYRHKGISWSKPRYVRVRKTQLLPTDSEIDQLIAGCTKDVGAFTQFVRETGCRRGEAYSISWMDIDLVNGLASITPEKHSNPRILKISGYLCGLLGTLPKDRKTVWTDSNLDNFSRLFMKQRARIVSKLQNPRLRAIHWHTLRHFKGTMEYHRTRDIVYVQKTLGHRSIQNTLTYVQLLPYGKDEYTAKAGTTLEEISTLIEEGFDYVSTLPDGVQLFRKRK